LSHAATGNLVLRHWGRSEQNETTTRATTYWQGHEAFHMPGHLDQKTQILEARWNFRYHTGATKEAFPEVAA